MKRRLSAIAFPLLLTGCLHFEQPVRTHVMGERFDAQEMQRLLQRGPLKFNGTAFLRQQGGGVVTCAGARVYLVPDTPYARERQAARYGTEGPQGYEVRSPIKPMLRFIPDPPDFERMARSSVCDAQGNFEFDGLLPGAYYVSTVVAWSAGGYMQGGALMARVDLTTGQSPRVVMTASP